MADVLGAEKHAAGKIFKKDSRLNQSGNRLQAKPADCLNSFIYFPQLRNTIGSEMQALKRRQVLGAGIRLMSWFQRCPDCAPDFMLFCCVRCFWNRFSRPIRESKLRNLIAASAVSGVAKAGMIGIEFHNRVSICRLFVSRCDAQIDVIGK